jgi:hypothetical protein
MELEFVDTFSKKYSNINFLEIPASGSRVVPCGQKDGETDRYVYYEANSRFRNFANEPKICELFPLSVFMCSIFFLR